MIDGVEIKELTTHADERGFFRELVRCDEAFFSQGFGQLSHSLVLVGVLKAWHGHLRQTQWTYVVAGTLKIAVHDCRPKSPTSGETIEFSLGDNSSACIYRLPPGTVHGYRVVSGPAHVIYVTSGTYDPTEEVRIAHDDQTIDYEWASTTTK